MSSSWIFLLVSACGAWFTFNAFRPFKGTHPLTIPSFFSGWLASEMPVHHLVLQLAVTGIFVHAGALEHWPGWIGLALCVLSWGGLWALLRSSRATGALVEGVLSEGLGVGYRQRFTDSASAGLEVGRAFGRGLNPFLLIDGRVSVERDIEYAPGAGKRRHLDVYRPRAGVTRAPVLFQIHGGGWIMGHKAQQARPLLYQMAARGWVCVSVNYRLSPRARFPDHLIDLKLAIRWVKEHIAEYGGDPGFIAVTGGSAGGHLCAMTALTANDPEYQPGFEQVDTSVQAAVPFYGVYDFCDRFQQQAGLRRFIEKLVMPRGASEEAFDRASPISRVHEAAPPFLVIHGSHDSLALREEAVHFVDALRKVSRSRVLHAELPFAQHAFEVFHSTRTRHVIDAVYCFLSHAQAEYLAQKNQQVTAE